MDMFHYQLITWLNKKIGRRKVAFLYMSDTWEIMTNQKKWSYYHGYIKFVRSSMSNPKI